MSMSEIDFNVAIATKINSVESNCPVGGTTQLYAFAKGIIDELKIATVTYSDFPAYELGGIISGMSGSNLANNVKTYGGYPSVTSKLLAKCTAIVTHLTIGICNSGKIIGYSDTILAGLIAAALGVSVTSVIQQFSGGITEYVLANADVQTGSPFIEGAIS